MPKGKRAFSKKNSVTYRLVPAERSSDENAPKHIFVPVPKGSKKLLPFPKSVSSQVVPQPGDVVFGSSKDKKLQIDPDVQAALEDDFDFSDPENALEDDFITKANSKGKEGKKQLTREIFGDACEESDDESIVLTKAELVNDSSNNQPGFSLGNRDCSTGNEELGSEEFPSGLTESDHRENLRILSEKFSKLLESHDEEENNQTQNQHGGQCQALKELLNLKSEQSNQSFDESDFEDDSFDSDGTFSDEGTNHCKKKYSLSSRTANYSAFNQPATLTTLDKQLEKMLEAYDDDQIGALDYADLDDCQAGGDFMAEMLLELKKQKSKKEEEECLVLGSYDDETKLQILEYASKEKHEKFVEIVTEKSEEFDCESILSAYSSIYNHPSVIKSDSHIPPRLHKQKLTKKNLRQLEEENREAASDDEASDMKSLCRSRPKNETADERRSRKKLVKEAKRENRALKKENKLAFKEEKRRQGIQRISSQQNAGIKIV